MLNMAEALRMEKRLWDLLKRGSLVLESGRVRRGTEKGRLYADTTLLGFSLHWKRRAGVRRLLWGEEFCLSFAFQGSG